MYNSNHYHPLICLSSIALSPAVAMMNKNDKIFAFIKLLYSSGNVGKIETGK